MEKKDIYNNRIKFLSEAKDIMSCKDFILFVFGNKNGLYINLDGYKKVEIEIMLDIIESFIKQIYKKKLYFGLSDNSLIIGKSNFSTFKAKDKEYDYKLGKFLSIPECCAKKYQEEENTQNERSYKSVLRYLNQCKKLRIKKDLFDVCLYNEGGDCSSLGYGFIPCHPLCKNALKIDKNYNKIMEKLKWKKKN